MATTIAKATQVHIAACCKWVWGHASQENFRICCALKSIVFTSNFNHAFTINHYTILLTKACGTSMTIDNVILI